MRKLSDEGFGEQMLFAASDAEPGVQSVLANSLMTSLAMSHKLSVVQAQHVVSGLSMATATHVPNVSQR